MGNAGGGGDSAAGHVGVEAAGARRVKGTCWKGVSDAFDLMFSFIARLMMFGEKIVIKVSCIPNYITIV